LDVIGILRWGRVTFAAWLLSPAMLSARAATSVMLQDFEKPFAAPTVWVVNIPDENASVTFSTNAPHQGKQCLKLHYHFLDSGKFQYLGIPNKITVQAPVHQLRFWMKGDNSKCSYGIQLTDAHRETHQYSKNTGQGGIIDFTGWKEIVTDVDSGHETWGGDKNGKLDYPLTAITLTIGQPMDKEKLVAVESDIYFDAISVEADAKAPAIMAKHISVLEPAYCSDIKGNTKITLSAAGFTNVTAKCWKQGPGFGSDSIVATLTPDSEGKGSFDFPADDYPHGPITVRIGAQEEGNNCYLQLYNRGGVSWKEGIPREPPPAAKGMSLVFADDFNARLSISSTDPQARYADHKPGGGDFSSLPFADFHSSRNPFAQVETYLRIRASERTHSAGLISSVKNDGTGIKAAMPCYFECRFIAPNAIGAWPAFWLLTDWDPATGHKGPCDELDIIEAYGGEGPREPNAYDRYEVTPHAWNQGPAGKAGEAKAQKQIHNPISMKKAGIPSTWFETFHTYGCKITETDTIYYCNDIEVGRHKTLEASRQRPFYFLINLATGSGWPVDLSPYDGIADMYVDYVRVYAVQNARR
jgi:hypothetical protein